jgi:hypothetical protein
MAGKRAERETAGQTDGRSFCSGLRRSSVRGGDSHTDCQAGHHPEDATTKRTDAKFSMWLTGTAANSRDAKRDHDRARGGSESNGAPFHQVPASSHRSLMA